MATPSSARRPARRAGRSTSSSSTPSTPSPTRGHEEVWRGREPAHARRRCATLDDVLPRARHRAGAEPEQLRAPPPLAGPPALPAARRSARRARAPVEQRTQGALQPLSRSIPAASRCSTTSTTQLLPCFRSRRVQRRARRDVRPGPVPIAARPARTRGRGRVYLDFLRADPRPGRRARDRRMQFWGDIVLEHPELIARAARRRDRAALGLRGRSSVRRAGGRLADAGLEFYVCPGTSSLAQLRRALEQRAGEPGRRRGGGRRARRARAPDHRLGRSRASAAARR